MFKLKKIKLKKVKIFFRELPRFLSENAFLTLLGLLLFSLILGAFTFYQYSILAEKVKPEVTDEPLQFKEKTYQAILKTLEEKERKFKETDSKKYFNPLQPIQEEQGSSPVPEPKEGLPTKEIELLLATTSLFKFYIIKGEIFNQSIHIDVFRKTFICKKSFNL